MTLTCALKLIFKIMVVDEETNSVKHSGGFEKHAHPQTRYHSYRLLTILLSEYMQFL